MTDRRRKSGRATPPAGPDRVRPGARGFDPDHPGQVGRRPSSAGFLLLVSIMWVGVGVIILITVHWKWRLIPAIVAIGIGLLFLRGLAVTVVRRTGRPPRS